MHLASPLLLAVGLGLCTSCSGDLAQKLPPQPGPDGGISEAGPLALTTNPEGIAYPTDNIGGQPKSDLQAGQIFPNLALEGVLSAAAVNTPVVVPMADYYDPEGLRYDLLHVIAIFMWCPHCNNETYNLAAVAGWQASQRVTVVQIAMQGYDRNTGASPTWPDLRQWATDHNVNFPVVIDGQGAQLAAYFPVGSVPVNIVVNPRTMEVLAVDVGEVTDIQSYEQGFLAGL
jgi:hypothetical protein